MHAFTFTLHSPQVIFSPNREIYLLLPMPALNLLILLPLLKLPTPYTTNTQVFNQAYIIPIIWIM